MGLVLGDAVGTSPLSVDGVGLLRSGVSTQLAAFTVEGLIRARVRLTQKGICHAPSVIWHAYCRWAFLQGIEHEAMAHRWKAGSLQDWPDGWLADVPALSERRGNAPATVTALKAGAAGTVEKPSTKSAGCHALTRTLPVAAALSRREPPAAAKMARELAAQTHGSEEAHDAAAIAAHIAVSLIHGTPFNESVNLSFTAIPDVGMAMLVDHAQTAAAKLPGEGLRLRELAPKSTAMHALTGGLYAALSFPRRGQIRQALMFAAQAPDPDSVAAVTGAFLGALHGANALPVDLLSRLESNWVLDTLARDLTAQILSPASIESAETALDPHHHRYPGW